MCVLQLGFVSFDDPVSASSAMTAMDGFMLQGKKLDVKLKSGTITYLSPSLPLFTFVSLSLYIYQSLIVCVSMLCLLLQINAVVGINHIDLHRINLFQSFFSSLYLSPIYCIV